MKFTDYKTKLESLNDQNLFWLGVSLTDEDYDDLVYEGKENIIDCLMEMYFRCPDDAPDTFAAGISQLQIFQDLDANNKVATSETFLDVNAEWHFKSDPILIEEFHKRNIK